MNSTSVPRLRSDTLLIVPCSGSKRLEGEAGATRSILTCLPPAHADALSNARAALRDVAKVDETTLLPAYRRYSGELYVNGSLAIGTALSRGQRVLIVSGAYGVVVAEELIGSYEKRFSLSDWPSGLLSACILEYARREKIRSVVAVMARSTDYAKLVRRVDWKSAGLTAALVFPADCRQGALRKVPRAQGQAIAALMDDDLGPDWRSSDGLSLKSEVV